MNNTKLIIVVPCYNEEEVLQETCRRLEEIVKANSENMKAFLENLNAYPSIRFGVETALIHYQAQSLQLWQ